MIRSSVNLHFLMSAALLVGGLLLLQVGTAGGGHAKVTAPRIEAYVLKKNMASFIVGNYMTQIPEKRHDNF